MMSAEEEHLIDDGGLFPGRARIYKSKIREKEKERDRDRDRDRWSSPFDSEVRRGAAR